MKTIFLSAGHSNTDPGVCAHGLTEAGIVCEFRNLVAFYLHRANVAYSMDGDGDTNLPLPLAAKMASQYGIAVEFHCNGGPDAATGVESLSGPKDMALGAQLSAGIARVLGIRDRGAKPENAGQHSRLAFVRAGGIIVELFFLTNKGDLDQYQAKKWLVAREVAGILLAAAAG